MCDPTLTNISRKERPLEMIRNFEVAGKKGRRLGVCVVTPIDMVCI